MRLIGGKFEVCTGQAIALPFVDSGEDGQVGPK